MTTDVREDWMKMNIKAINYIYSAVSNKQLEYTVLFRKTLSAYTSKTKKKMLYECWLY